MSQLQRLTFAPINNDSSLSGEFECWEPKPEFAAQEQEGDCAWQGSTELKPIKSEEGLPEVNLPAMLMHMEKYCWQKASATGNMPRTGVHLGNARQARFDMTPQPATF